jgi:DMSO/TMAO reductase YedYZ molybdopterin-dependent catalytic subunit
LRLGRREFLVASAAAAGTLSATGQLGAAESWVELPIGNGKRPLVKYPMKRAMIVQSSRPPILETPFEVFNESDVTPNDAFYVRWHEAGFPTSVDAADFRLQVHGVVKKPLSLSVADLRKQFEPVEIVAVNQCSGNSRGLFNPRVAGGQWANGGMGNARWKGARLTDILAKAGVDAGAKQVSLHGLDHAVLPETPRFQKAFDIETVTANPDMLVAYEMNGEPLPLLNGFPVRLVAPGWYATYWVKMLSDIEVIDHVDGNFWMATAYRIPDTPGNSVTPDQTGYKTIPINKMHVRSFVTNISDGDFISGVAKPDPMYPLRFSAEIRGIAFDGGSGIKMVEFSDDGGKTWSETKLGGDLGKYSFRRWSTRWNARAGSGAHTLACRATANNGEVQTNVAVWNPAGYLKNNIETYTVTV